MNHQNISFIKSTVRIVGYATLMFSVTIGVVVLIVSELLGFLEELV